MKETNTCIGEHMAVTQRMLNSFLRYKLENTDINASQFIFLMHLFKKDGQSQEQINRSIQYDKGVIARMAIQLEKDAYITRQSNPQDKRANSLHLTEKAKGFYPKMIDILVEWNDVLLCDESEEEIKKLSEIVERIALRSINKIKEVKNGKK